MKRTWSGKKVVSLVKGRKTTIYGRRKRHLVCSCHLLLDLLPGFVSGHQIGELLLCLLEVVIEVLLVAKVKSLCHHRVFCKLLVHAVHWNAKNLGDTIIIQRTVHVLIHLCGLVGITRAFICTLPYFAKLMVNRYLCDPHIQLWLDSVCDVAGIIP